MKIYFYATERRFDLKYLLTEKPYQSVGSFFAFLAIKSLIAFETVINLVGKRNNFLRKIVRAYLCCLLWVQLKKIGGNI